MLALIKSTNRAAVARPTALFQSIRQKTSLIPPNVASLKEIGRLQSAHPQAHPEIFAKMKNFYARIPKGPRVHVPAKTIVGRYYENYIAKDSLISIIHFLGVMIPVGYYLSYFKGGTTPASSSTEYEDERVSTALFRDCEYAGY
ncbi:hypothetical protein HDU76_003084 [Blyttiomyces sp. JEL0837]|nr:hypothetical protein HDU76_003084 [Blyttiomyces sp. JEL0837]